MSRHVGSKRAKKGAKPPALLQFTSQPLKIFRASQDKKYFPTPVTVELFHAAANMVFLHRTTPMQGILFALTFTTSSC